MAVKPDTVTVYRDVEGQVRWRWQSANGLTLGDSGQGYAEPRNARWQAKRLARGVGAELVDTTR